MRLRIVTGITIALASCAPIELAAANSTVVTFNSPRLYSGPGNAIVSADLNGDGKPDLVAGGVSATNSGAIEILLGKGECAFRKGETYTTTAVVTSVTVGDFNGDGKPDVAATTGNQIAILLGNGDGTFRGPVYFNAGGIATAVAVADFNVDGKLDLAVVNTGVNAISVLLGNGDGTFGSPSTSPASTGPAWLAAGDFNGDGRPDLAVGTFGNFAKPEATGSIVILLGKGDGTFSAPVTYGSGRYYYVLAGDFNGDGNLDLATADYAHNAGIAILLGNGNGTFQPPVIMGAAGSSLMAIGDFNNDGIADLATDIGAILIGDGAGGFQRSAHGFQGGVALAVGAFSGDGHLDIAATALADSGMDGSIYIVPGGNHATFEEPKNYAMPPSSISVGVGDFNGDGKLDLAIPVWGATSGAQILFGNGDGTFQEPLSSNAGESPYAIAVADFNGDGKLDLAITQAEGYSVDILLGNGDGSFQPPQTFGTGDFPAWVGVADFNGDGVPDLLVRNIHASTYCILLGRGDGTFKPTLTFNLDNLGSVRAGDFNGDGKSDLAVTIADYQAGTSTVSILVSNGDGTFTPGATYNGVPHNAGLAVGDLNGDGKLDLILPGKMATWVMLGNGDGTFQSPLVMDFTGANLIVADFDGDGIPDLAMLGVGASVALGNGDGTFSTPWSFALGNTPFWLAAGDFNGDGKLDLVDVSEYTGYAVLLNMTK